MIFIHVFLLFTLISTFTTLILSQSELDNQILVGINILNLCITSFLLVVIAKHRWRNRISYSSPLWLTAVAVKLVSIPISVLFFSDYLLTNVASCTSSLCLLERLTKKRYLLYVILYGSFLGISMIKIILWCFDINQITQYKLLLHEFKFDVFECVIQVLLVAFLIFYKNVENSIKIETIRNFSNVMAHEVLKPTAIIETQLGFLNNQKLDTAAQKILADLTVTCRRIRSRTNFIMQNARIVSNIYHSTKHNTSVRAVISKCVQNYQIDGLNVFFTAHNDISFNGPSGLIRCICDNMVENAYQHCGTNVRIEITISENYIIFQDNVGGIKTSDLENIFEIFNTSKEHKLGIGLAICKDIVNSYGGNIKCISLEGHHTTFIIKLPCTVSPAKIA